MNANTTTLTAIACLIVWSGLAAFFLGIISRRPWWLRMVLIVLGLVAYAVGSYLFEQLPIDHP